VALTVTASGLLGLAALLIPSPLVALPVGATLLVAPAVNAALFAAMLSAAPREMHGRINRTVIMALPGFREANRAARRSSPAVSPDR
jgi:hypothetical protein